MPAPSTLDEFMELVHKSNVVDLKRLDAFIQKSGGRTHLPVDPAKLAPILIREGVLTNFQAQQFLLGKWRGFTIGNYKVLERLGSGGMGNVYLCEHQVMRKRVAIKVLANVSAENPEMLKRFYREARAAAALDHPNIVRAHDVGKEDKLHFLVMDYVDGVAMEEIVRRFGPMDVIRAAHYIAQAATGLQFAHAAGLIHRDIKPANLILDRNGVVKVLDMGVARFCEEDDEVLTKGPLGTADYLAPEQARDSHGVDARADIYGLGATFYFFLTGQVPFPDGKSVAQKIMFLQTKEPRPVREIRAEVPDKMVKVVEKMMAKDPKNRYAQAKDIVQDLAPWTKNPIPYPPSREMPHLSIAAQGTGDGTDPNLGMTPAPSEETASAAPAAPQRPAPQRPAPQPPAPHRPAPYEPPPPTPATPEPPSIFGVVVLTVLITLVVLTSIWWVFLRPPG